MAKRGRGLIGSLKTILRNKSVKYNVKKIIYKTLIRPSVTYASAVWAKKKNMKELEIMGRWAFRYALDLIRVKETKKYVSNKIIYDLMEMEKIDEFTKECKRRHKFRVKTHSNKLVCNSRLYSFK